MNPFDSMMVVLSDIRDGIYSFVDKFSESYLYKRPNTRLDYGTRPCSS